MKTKHIITWIPIIGIITGCLYGLEDDSPVQKFTFLNAVIHAIGISLLLFGVLL